MRRLLFLFLMGGILVPAFAEEEGILSKLLAPGPTVKGHASLEGKDCLKCHDAAKGVPDEKCLECHKAIRPFVEEKRGFHGLTKQSCRECHSDHKGRDYDSVALDETNFNHGQLTGYKLEGKHTELKCADCHKDTFSSVFVRAGKTRYFGSQASCVSCHKKDDVHFFQGEWAKKDCVSCHGLASWAEGAKFDHEKETKYRLVGKHATLKCADCHGPNKAVKSPIYDWPQLKKAECLSCHQDFHKTNLSKRFQNGKCATCHDQKRWAIKDFDHQVTGYPLRGKHFELKCLDCHTQKGKDTKALELKNFKFSGLRSTCVSCHDDYHLFPKMKTKHFGDPNRCQACHTEKSWQGVTKFDHNAHTRYAIDGKHMELDCLSCHVTQDKKTEKILRVSYQWQNLATKTCETCHASPHLKEFSPTMLKKQCTECHVTSGWFDMKGKQSFNHNQTRFPLTGAHSKTQCSECHGDKGKQVFKFKSVEAKFCIDCHTNIHKNQFSDRIQSNNCADCHTTENFTRLREFDHFSTRYPLEGAHTKVNCQLCHISSGERLTLVSPNIGKKVAKNRTEITLNRYLFPKVSRESCLECHADYHQGQLDSKCLNCHAVKSWKPVSFDHDRESSFPLKFKHKELKCTECHTPTKQTVVYKEKKVRVVKYKPMGSTCVSCHKDVHKGAFGKACQECHVEKGWQVTRDFHRNFTLTGVHYSLNCMECHQDPQRRLSGLSQQCITCHAKDDVHSGTQPNCGDCHRQQFWEVTEFKHSLTNFPLRGAHRTLDCMQCHIGGTYKGLSSSCVACHLQEALAVPVPNHAGFTNVNSCTDCHLNQFSWR